MEQLELFQRLAVALAIGLLIGLERGWHGRELREGSRVAGIRTFALIGLLGGFSTLLATYLGVAILGVMVLALAGILLVARARLRSMTRDFGATTIVSALLTFVLGAVAVEGQLAVAAAGAVIVALLLGIKPTLHDFVRKIDAEELLAVLKLLVMTVVLLPVLPDKGFGPWEFFNPYRLWLMVVLIAGISFVGYIAVRIMGTRRGILLSAFAGGLVSSTAVTLNLSRLVQDNPARSRILAGGIVLSATTMFPRTLLLVGVINPLLLQELVWPLGMATLAGLCMTALWFLLTDRESTETQLKLRNPFELTVALKFGLLLALVSMMAHGLKLWLGDTGVYVLAAVSGLADIDAVTLSLTTMTESDLTLRVAASGIVLAAVSNTLFKAAMAVYVGRAPLALPVLVGLGALVAGCLAGLALDGIVIPSPDSG